MVVNTILNLREKILSLRLNGCNLTFIDLSTQSLKSSLKLSELANRCPNSIANVVDLNQSVEHLLTITRSNSGLSQLSHLRNLAKYLATHSLREIQFLKLCLQDRLNNLYSRLTIGQLEVVPNTPPVLSAFHLHTNAELVTLLSNQTISLHLIHTPAEALGSTTHGVRILLVIYRFLIPILYLNHLVTKIIRRLRVNAGELSRSAVHIQIDG